MREKKAKTFTCTRDLTEWIVPSFQLLHIKGCSNTPTCTRQKRQTNKANHYRNNVSFCFVAYKKEKGKNSQILNHHLHQRTTSKQLSNKDVKLTNSLPVFGTMIVIDHLVRI